MTINQQQLYQQALLIHHKNPIGFERDINSNYQLAGYNSACGDEITIKVKAVNKVILQVAFSGESCAICRASASILCQKIEQLAISDYAKLSSQLRLLLSGEHSCEQGLVEAFLPLLSVVNYPVRQQCALLPWQTLDKLITAPTPGCPVPS